MSVGGREEGAPGVHSGFHGTACSKSRVRYVSFGVRKIGCPMPPSDVAARVTVFYAGAYC